MSLRTSGEQSSRRNTFLPEDDLLAGSMYIKSGSKSVSNLSALVVSIVSLDIKMLSIFNLLKFCDATL